MILLQASLPPGAFPGNHTVLLLVAPTSLERANTEQKVAMLTCIQHLATKEIHPWQ